jgi:hypothetical protein
MPNILFSEPKFCAPASGKAKKGSTALDIMLDEAAVQ